jgi:hypothetical protein
MVHGFMSSRAGGWVGMRGTSQTPLMSRFSAKPRGRCAPGRHASRSLQKRRPSSGFSRKSLHQRSLGGPSRARPPPASNDRVAILLKRQALPRCQYLVSHTHEGTQDSSVNRYTSGVWEVPRLPTRPRARDDRLIRCRRKRERTRARERERILIPVSFPLQRRRAPVSGSGRQPHTVAVVSPPLSRPCGVDVRESL